MNILCKIFGHKPPVYSERSWSYPGNEYGTLRSLTIDGIGRVHAEVHAECARCGKYHLIARVHIPVETVKFLDTKYQAERT